MLSYNNVLLISAVWTKLISFFLSVAAIFIVIIVGWILANIVGKFVKEILTILNADSLLEISGLKSKFEKSGVKIKLTVIGEEFSKWIVILLALIAATETAGLSQVSNFLNNILAYIPVIIISIIIIAIGVLLADFAYKVVKGSFAPFVFGSSDVLAIVVKWMVIIFSVLVALDQLGMKLEFIKILFVGLVAMASLAGGIAFGLGGKDMAREALEKMKNDFGKRGR